MSGGEKIQRVGTRVRSVTIDRDAEPGPLSFGHGRKRVVATMLIQTIASKDLGKDA